MTKDKQEKTDKKEINDILTMKCRKEILRRNAHRERKESG
jgi:hypothetical protein